MSMGINAFQGRSRAIGAGLMGLLLAVLTGCADSDQADQVPKAQAAQSASGGAAAAPPTRDAKVDVDAITATSTGVLVAGHRLHGESSQVWQCPSLTALSECE